MGRKPCCAKEGLNRGAWTAQEDKILTDYLKNHGEGKWRNIPEEAGLKRCGKSCRLRWLNYLRPDIKRGNISPDEEDLIIRLHKLLGNRWSLIAGRLPGRTDNEIKNYWNTNLSKKQKDINNNNNKNNPTTTTTPLLQSRNQKTKKKKLLSSIKPTKPPSPVESSSEVVKVKAFKYNGMPLTKKSPHLPEDHDPIPMIFPADDSIISNKMSQLPNEDDQNLSDFSVDFGMEGMFLDQDFHRMAGGEFDLCEFNNNHNWVEYGNGGVNHKVHEGGPSLQDDELNMVCGMESSLNGHFEHDADQTYAELQYLASFLGSSSSVEEWLGKDF